MVKFEEIKPVNPENWMVEKMTKNTRMKGWRARKASEGGRNKALIAAAIRYLKKPNFWRLYLRKPILYRGGTIFYQTATDLPRS